jgi:hypothetical protein
MDFGDYYFPLGNETVLLFFFFFFFKNNWPWQGLVASKSWTAKGLEKKLGH